MATPADERNKKIIERVKRELVRRANDRIKVYNPLDKVYSLKYDGFIHPVPAKADHVFPRYIAVNYFTHMTNHLITQENETRVKEENERRVKNGQKVMDPQEREVFDLDTRDEDLRKKYMKILYKGIVEEYGKGLPAEREEAKPVDPRPIDERLLEELEEETEPTVVETFQGKVEVDNKPLGIKGDDFDSVEDINIEGIEVKKEDLAQQIT